MSLYGESEEHCCFVFFFILAVTDIMPPTYEVW